MNMDYKFSLMLCLYITSICSSPLPTQLMPLQYWMQPRNPLMQLQNPFLRRADNNIQTPFMYPQQPIMVLLPNPVPAAESDDRFMNLNEDETTNDLKPNTGLIDEDNDAVILDAEPNPAEADFKKAVLRMQNNPRFMIGQIISYIPFLPIEINVPDSIAWIASLLPWFRRPDQKPADITRFSSKGPIPILVLPELMMKSI